jgi:hypothetical protein
MEKNPGVFALDSLEPRKKPDDPPCERGVDGKKSRRIRSGRRFDGKNSRRIPSGRRLDGKNSQRLHSDGRLGEKNPIRRRW